MAGWVSVSEKVWKSFEKTEVGTARRSTPWTGAKCNLLISNSPRFAADGARLGLRQRPRLKAIQSQIEQVGRVLLHNHNAFSYTADLIFRVQVTRFRVWTVSLN